MKKILLLMSLILCVAFKGLAQDKVKISGTVRDDKGEPLVGVRLYHKEQPNREVLRT